MIRLWPGVIPWTWLNSMAAVSGVFLYILTGSSVGLVPIVGYHLGRTGRSYIWFYQFVYLALGLSPMVLLRWYFFLAPQSWIILGWSSSGVVTVRYLWFSHLSGIIPLVALWCHSFLLDSLEAAETVHSHLMLLLLPLSIVDLTISWFSGLWCSRIGAGASGSWKCWEFLFWFLFKQEKLKAPHLVVRIHLIWIKKSGRVRLGLPYWRNCLCGSGYLSVVGFDYGRSSHPWLC